MKYQQKDIQHFSYHHVLVSHKLVQGDGDDQEHMNCNGCERPIIRDREPFHGCLSCNFWLDDDCLNTPRYLQHPSHPHTLTLLPTPTYINRSYSCSACGSSGTAFSLCCAQCEFDLHLHCANLPARVVLQEHPHELKLMFGSPYEDKNTKYGCDLCCGEMLQSEWLYYCPDCDFAAHLDCGTGKDDESKAHATGEPQETEEEYSNINSPDETGSATAREENPMPRGGNRGKAAKKKSRNNKKEVNGDGRRPSSHGDQEAGDDATEQSFYEAQRKMRETALAHKLMLQALDNAADYVGSSSQRYYYY